MPVSIVPKRRSTIYFSTISSNESDFPFIVQNSWIASCLSKSTSVKVLTGLVSSMPHFTCNNEPFHPRMHHYSSRQYAVILVWERSGTETILSRSS